MGSFFTALLEKFAQVVTWFGLVFKQIFVDLWNMITDVFVWVFDSLLFIAVSAIELIEIPFDPATYYSMIPSEVVFMLGYIKVPQALSIIVSALVIRFILQTVPFVRWGS